MEKNRERDEEACLSVGEGEEGKEKKETREREEEKTKRKNGRWEGRRPFEN